MSRTIVVPPGTDVRVSIRSPHYMVVAAPAPLKADLDAILSKPNVTGLFTFDPGVDWPDREGCRYATAYLAHGTPIVMRFDSLADALIAQKRLLASVVTP